MGKLDDVRYSPSASSNVDYFLFCVADMKCGLYEMNKNNGANATHGPSPVQKMFRGRTKAMLDRRGPGPGHGPLRSNVDPGPGPVLTLMIT